MTLDNARLAKQRAEALAVSWISDRGRDYPNII